MDWPDDCGGQWEQAVDKWLQSNTNISERISLPLEDSPRDDDTRSIGLIINSVTTVPAGCEIELMVTPVEKIGRGAWILEGEVSGRHGVMVAHALVCPNNQSVPIRVLNPREQPVVLKKGELIARMELVEQEPSGINAVDVTSSSTRPELSPENKEFLWNMVSEVGDHISSTEKEQLFSVLSAYGDVFSFHDNDVGHTLATKHRIDTGNAPPVHCPPRRMPHAQKEEVRKLLRDMLEKRVIQPSDSPWSSPIVLVKKKDGSVRFRIDYRKVNAITRKDAYPLPRVDDTLDTLAGSRLFTTLDLKNGYWQVEVEATKDSFQYVRRLREAGLRVKPSKCRFLQKEVKFLGHVVSENGISTDPGKTEAIQKWPVHRSRRELQQFLGLANYYRRFIKSFALIAKPLTEKNAPFEWTAACQKSFDDLRKCLASAPILAYPDHSKPFLLDTDASDVGIGAVLSQIQDNGSESVIAVPVTAMQTPYQEFRVGNVDGTNSLDEVRRMQAEDNIVGPVLEAVERGKVPEPDVSKSWSRESRLLLPHWDTLICNCGVLWRCVSEGKERRQLGKSFKTCMMVPLELIWEKKRWAEVYAIKNQEATTVSKKLVDEMFCRFSPPEQLHSDQGRQFESELLAEVCSLLKVRKSHTTPYHPQGNATGFSPFFLMFGREAKLPVDLMYGSNRIEERLSEHRRQKDIYDEKVHGKPFVPGELVWLPAVPRGQSRKLHLPWKGPLKVLERRGDCVYKIARPRADSHFPAAQQTSSRDDNSQSATTVQQPVGQPTIADELLDDDDEQPTDNDVQDEDGPAPVPDPRRYPTRDRRIPERMEKYSMLAGSLTETKSLKSLPIFLKQKVQGVDIILLEELGLGTSEIPPSIPEDDENYGDRVGESKCLKTGMEILHSNGNREVKADFGRIKKSSPSQKAAALANGKKGGALRRAPKRKIAEVVSADEDNLSC
eukprot:Em0025g122a